MVPAAPTVIVGVNVALSKLTSNPAGGVTSIPADMSVADTLNVPDEDAVP